MSHFTTFGDYALLSLVGSGSGAEVWRARRRTSLYQAGSDVALKRPTGAPSEALREALQREATALASITHPNLVPVREHGEVNGLPFLVMELIEGASLGRLLSAQEQGQLSLSPLQAGYLAHEVARGLQHLHAQGLIHRDLSPQNVLLSLRGEVRLSDFGLALHARAQASAAEGTPGYMSPAQLAGGAPSPSWDLFALGVLLWELLAAERLFAGLSADELAARWRAGVAAPSQRRAGLPTALDEIARRALSTESPYESAAALADALAACLGELGPQREGLGRLVHEHFPPSCVLQPESLGADGGHLIAVDPELLPSGAESTSPATQVPFSLPRATGPAQPLSPAQPIAFAPTPPTNAARLRSTAPTVPQVPASTAPLAPASFLPSEAPKNAAIPGLADVTPAPRPVKLRVYEPEPERELRPIRIEAMSPEDEDEEEDVRPMFDMPDAGPGWPVWIGALLFLVFIIGAGAWMLTRT